MGITDLYYTVVKSSARVKNAMTDELVKVAEDSARGSFFLISGTALATAILAIASIFVGRVLGPKLYGQYTLAFVVPQLFFLFTDLGINQGIIKFTASLRAKGETNRVTEIIQHGLVLKVSAGIAIFIINYTFADFFASFFLQRPDLGFYMRIASTAILFQVIFITVISAFVGLDKTEYSALTRNINAIAQSVISIALVLLGFSVAGAIVGYVASYVAAAFAGLSLLFLITRQKPHIINNHSITDDFKTLMHYGAPIYISVLLAGFIPIYKNVMLANFTTDADIGNYRAAINFATLMTGLSIPITTALLPAFSKLDSSTTSHKIRTFFKLANKYITIIIMPITFLIIMFCNEIVQIVYGSTYQSAPQFLAIYCLLYFLVGLGYLTLASFYNGLGETKKTLQINLIAFLTLAALSPILTKAYGVPGLIIAFIVANTTGISYGAYIAKRNFQIEFEIRSIMKIYLISAISCVPSILMLRLTSLPKLFNVVIGGFLCLFIYTTLVPLMKIVTIFELQAATHIVQKIPLLRFIAKPIFEYQRRIINARIV